MNSTTILGCVPILGTFIGANRIYAACKKAQEQHVSDTSLSIFASLKKTNGFEEVFHGACEIIPIVGPLFYGAVTLCIFIAKKIHSLLFPQKPESIIHDTQPPETRERIIDATHVNTCEGLREYIGKKIKIRVPRYANEHFTLNYRDLHNNIYIDVKGKLLDVDTESYFNRGRHAITIQGHHRKTNREVCTYYVSDNELRLSTDRIRG